MIRILKSYNQTDEEFYLQVKDRIFEVNLKDNLYEEVGFEGGLDADDGAWKSDIIIEM